MTYLRYLVGLAALCASFPASSKELLPVHPKLPAAAIFERHDFAGRNSTAKAKVGPREAAEWCANWKPGDDEKECVKEMMQSEGSKVYEASADCFSGKLRSVDGKKYIYSGIIENDPMWSGWQKFQDGQTGAVIGTDNASGGIGLAALWRTLCPYGMPLDKYPLKTVLSESDYSGFGEIAGHNNSGMLIDSKIGTITYREPKKSVAALIKPNAVLFRGSIIYDGPVDGMAFTFKKGCDPAPYHVEGHFQSNSDKLVLSGKSPVRDGCKVVGYTDKSPNARLVFDLPHH